MNRIALFLAEGFEEIEALTVVDLCRRAGLLVTMAAVPGENGEQKRSVSGSHGITVEADAVLSQVDFAHIDMIVLPGGMPGTKNLEACDELMEQVDSFVSQGKYVAAICAAPSILGHRGLLQGKRACCYPGFEEALSGALTVDDSCVQDGKIITSRGMGCAIDFSLAIVKVFCGEEKAEELARAIIYLR